ncbi:hypothetical protein AB1Y20_014912 [Prymnesium parvum]|uniref:glucan 1,4-alpha-glucosidase n=1 Tax=Prymnesium parvum TaxID=97485 RepID=A0AB34JV74_PRYPA
MLLDHAHTRRPAVACGALALLSLATLRTLPTALHDVHPPTPPSCFVLRPGGPPFAAAELSAIRRLLAANVNVNGTGAVVAAPDHHTGPGGSPHADLSADYYWHWPRDAALAIASLERSGLASLAQLRAYAAWEAALLARPPASRSPIDPSRWVPVGTEPKFAIPSGAPFDAPWCRPQNDAPALRLLALLPLATRLLGGGGGGALERASLWRADGGGTLQASVAYIIGGGWREATCDLWEEVISADLLWNRLLMARGAEAAAPLADALGEPELAAACRATAAEIRRGLASHVGPGGALSEAPRAAAAAAWRTGAAEARAADGALVLALNLGFDAPRPAFAPLSREVGATVARLTAAFCREYPINADAAEAGVPGVLYGRYPGDEYHGGNPWILTTAALAQLLYRVGLALCARSGAEAEPPDAAVMRIWAETLNAPELAAASPADAARIFSSAGDSVLSRIAHYVRESNDGDFVLYEQLDKHTGKQTSARSLTWSYAEVLDALHWRTELRRGPLQCY